MVTPVYTHLEVAPCTVHQLYQGSKHCRQRRGKRGCPKYDENKEKIFMMFHVQIYVGKMIFSAFQKTLMSSF